MTLGVRCEGLTAGWPGKVLVDGFNMDEAFVGFNHTLPIIGRTGRGKSTLLYALSGMAEPLRGRISWRFPSDPAPTTWSADGRSFKAAESLRRHRFGFLLQDASMIPCFTVKENLGHLLRLRGVTDRIGDRIHKAVSDMLIDGESPKDFLDIYPTRLSGGMRQRMALAAAIAHDPAVLFADEPTASLDDQSGLEVLRVIRHWLDEREGERAFIFVTHRVEMLDEGLEVPRALELKMRNIDGASRIAAVWRKMEREPLSLVG